MVAHNDNTEIVQAQLDETVKQELAGVTVRMATITCPCGWRRAVVKLYKCLYCGVWFCQPCAEQHFGKTLAAWRREKDEQELSTS